ncbi:hypothetical protein B0H63DRAFT_470741 [Podospora didyma]|uniref:Uncharacterized protein n=1 Tax=Podospora didyma TaxID=330526 RepID=A0AAE0U219_9PEZI|nr:hypothetical protein B0H63DRAFT_470741 [Podospora didyma]
MSASGNKLIIHDHEVIPLEVGYVGSKDPDNYDDVIKFNQTSLPLPTIIIPTLQINALDIVSLEEFFESKRFVGSLLVGSDVPVESGQAQGLGDAFCISDMAQIVNNMTESMTDCLRSGYSAVIEGYIHDEIVFVEVWWEWLVMPLVVELASVVFVLFIMVESRRAMGLYLWKSPTVAVLFHGLAWRRED